MNNIGSTLVIANPASHSGRGAASAKAAQSFFEAHPTLTTSFELKITRAPGDAQRMATEARGYDTLVVLGGDGVIHEAVNGLMAIDEGSRPRLGIVPFGSGNDYARTLGLATDDPQTALAQLVSGTERVLDVGHVISDEHPDGAYFTESLSFGLDAAIAIDTTRRRAAGARQQGEGLFLTSSIKLALRASKGYRCEVRIDDDEPLQLTSLIFAVLNGPTYGGGFRICPGADPCDGLLDVCYNVRQPWTVHLMVLLGLARFGRHAHSRIVRLRKLKTAQIRFLDDVPCQIDGEELRGSRFTIKVVPQALRVIAANQLASGGCR